MKKPAPFQRLEDRRIDAPRRLAEPATKEVRPANTMLPATRRATLPLDGPGQIRVVVTGPSIRLVPTDRTAETRLLAARAQLGWGWDAKAGRRIDYFSLLLRNGATNFDAVRLLAESTGLSLIVDSAAEREIARRARRLARDLAPIPRVIWTDDEEHGEREISADRTLGRH
jgi:hypothetical protein